MSRSDIYEDYRSTKLKSIFTDGSYLNPLLEFHHKYATEVRDLEDDYRAKINQLDESYKERHKVILERNNDFEFKVLKERMEIAEQNKQIQEERKQLEEEISSWEEKVFNLSLQSKLNKRRKNISLNNFVIKKHNNSSKL